MRRAPARPLYHSIFVAATTVGASCTDAPSIFRSAGPEARDLGTLGWTLTAAAIVVVAVVSALLMRALLRARPEHSGAVQRTGSSTRWIVIGGVIVPAITLVASFVFTVQTQSRVADPPRAAVATIRVIGHRWWWEIQYASDTAENTVVTANEIHVPVGEPVRLELTSGDVIHSFWVPRLAGKTDLIPGQQNTMWLQADSAGAYRGECAEYCGVQHAHMDFVVVAEPPDRFEAWLASQRSPAAAPVDPLARQGHAVFEHGPCAACHAIRGTGALARVGPDLTHLASRRTIAAGALENTRDDVSRWIADAQSIKPGSGMPDIPLSRADAEALVAYLETLH